MAIRSDRIPLMRSIMPIIPKGKLMTWAPLIPTIVCHRAKTPHSTKRRLPCHNKVLEAMPVLLLIAIAKRARHTTITLVNSGMPK
jgi:hypothetical protein